MVLEEVGGRHSLVQEYLNLGIEFMTKIANGDNITLGHIALEISRCCNCITKMIHDTDRHSCAWLKPFQLQG